MDDREKQLLSRQTQTPVEDIKTVPRALSCLEIEVAEKRSIAELERLKREDPTGRKQIEAVSRAVRALWARAAHAKMDNTALMILDNAAGCLASMAAMDSGVQGENTQG